jgi:hypothetical protein
MRAEISVRPAAAAAIADQPRPRAEWSSNPTPFGLY